MRIVQTYYSKDGQLNPFIYDMAMLSCVSMKVVSNYDVVLYTNIADKFSGIPYDNVIDTDFGMDSIDARFWNFAKLYTYAQQSEPFLHVDIDTCFLDGFAVPKGDIVTELVRHPAMTDGIRRFSVNGVETDEIICSGLVGGSKYGDVFKRLHSYAMEFCSKVANEGVDVTYEHLISIEEHVLTQICKEDGVGIDNLKSGTFMHFWCERDESKEEKFGETIRSLQTFFNTRYAMKNNSNIYL